MLKTNSLHVTVTERALMQRINRALPKGRAVKIARGKKIESRGLFYLAEGGTVLDENVDIEKLGRELGVLRLYERCEDVAPVPAPTVPRVHPANEIPPNPDYFEESRGGHAWPHRWGIQGWARRTPRSVGPLVPSESVSRPKPPKVSGKKDGGTSRATLVSS
jgi:hypothetical protein